MQPASAPDIQPAISLLAKTPHLLETLLGDLPGELLHWKPAPDRWSISEVLAHLAALEQVYADRALRVVAEDSPALMKYDLAGASARGDYLRGSAGENLALFTRTRRSTLAMLTGLPVSAGARAGVHSELGAVSLAHMLNEWANHDLGHLRQIAELYRAYAFHPNSGPFRTYSTPKP
ncbi:MAG TPA: DinB family protein [Methylomirabilota bacterium]|nr:DinB family protein [Methylomirabilota bacterium]